MGSWMKTCGLSSLHIAEDTPVYVFVMELHRDFEPVSCYTSSAFRPLLIPFESVYNDYGGGENSSGAALNLIMDAIRPMIDKDELPSGVYQDTFSVDDFFTASHDGKLVINRPYSSTPTHLTFTMFRKDVVDHILNTRHVQDYVGPEKGTHGWSNSYIRFKFEDIVADIRPFIDNLASGKLLSKSSERTTNLMLNNRVLDLETEYQAMLKLSLQMAVHDADIYNKLIPLLRVDKFRFSRLVDINRVIIDYVDTGKHDELEALLTDFAKGAYIDSFMMAARKQWTNGGHDGSQSHSTGALRLLCDTINLVLDEEDREWNEENESDGEERDRYAE